MKKIIHVFLLLFLTASMGMNSNQEIITLECVKRHHASNTCHYNFLVNGIQHRYLDNGCKGKKDDIIKKAQAGKLALAKKWKIECPKAKEKPN